MVVDVEYLKYLDGRALHAYHGIIEEVDATQCDAMRLPSNSVKKHSLLSLSIKIIHSKGYTDFYAG